MTLNYKQQQALLESNRESQSMTRICVQDALFLLMQKNRYEDISITDIINKSGISRSAFYRNFKTKEDILDEKIRYCIQMVISSLTKSHFANWKIIFKTIIENKDIILLLEQAGLVHKIYDGIRTYAWKYGIMDEFLFQVWVGVIYSTTLFFLEHEAEYTIDEFINMAMERLDGLKCPLHQKEA